MKRFLLCATLLVLGVSLHGEEKTSWEKVFRERESYYLSITDEMFNELALEEKIEMFLGTYSHFARFGYQFQRWERTIVDGGDQVLDLIIKKLEKYRVYIDTPPRWFFEPSLFYRVGLLRELIHIYIYRHNGIAPRYKAKIIEIFKELIDHILRRDQVINGYIYSFNLLLDDLNGVGYSSRLDVPDLGSSYREELMLRYLEEGYVVKGIE